jgi:hypothetical protein
MSFYNDTSDAALAQDIVLKAGKLYASEFLSEGTGTMGTPGATAAITLSEGVASDDLYNGKTLFIVDDNSVLCSVVIDDSETSGGTITVDTTACDKVSDAVTAGSWTAAGTYSYYILGTEEFVGYSTQTLSYEEELVEFYDDFEKVRDDITKVILGFDGECRNVSTDKTLANVFNLSLYGSQTGQKEYHGGFTPPAKTYFSVRLATENVNDKSLSVTMFKGQFFGAGSVDFAASGEYKVVPFSYKSVKDTLRDSGSVNGWKITEAT